MDSLLPVFLCFTIVAVLLAINYILVTIQERREGKSLPWTPDQINWDAADDPAIREMIVGGKKIEAIKHYRNLTGAGLKEAKDAIDYIVAHPNEMGEKKKAPRIDLDDAPGVRDLLEEGREDEAIEVYQKFAGVDEYTARDAVEHIKKRVARIGW